MRKKLRRFRSLFVPSAANNYRAKALHLPFLAGFVFVFLLVQSSLSLISLSRPSVLGYSSGIQAEEIVDLTNQERAKLGLSQLTISPRLNEAALRKASDMFALDYWSHDSPTGRDPWSFFAEVDYDYLYAGENLARDFASSEAVVSAWMASESHRDNIVNGNYQEIGVAVVKGDLAGLNTTLVVQLFGTPSLTKGTVSSSQASNTNQAYALTDQDDPFADQEPISPLSISKAVSLSILVFLIIVLLVDRLLANRKKVNRLAGDNLAHVIFLTAILLIIIFFQAGLILEPISSL